MTDRDQRIELALRRFTRSVDEAGDWFLRDEITPTQRTRQATSVILRGINKLASDIGKDGTLNELLAEMYLAHIGRKVKPTTDHKIVGAGKPWTE